MPPSEDHVRFVIVLSKTGDAPLAPETIRRHIEHLRALDRDGSLVLCGPFADHPSGMVVVKAKDKAAAEAIARADPFVREGVRTFEVRTWLLACAENGSLG